MPRKLKPPVTFLIDSREQHAFTFAAPVRAELADGGSRIFMLKEGDYSVSLGDPDYLASGEPEPLSIRIERKEIGDLFNCCGWERDRFVRELERLTQYDYRAIVVEASAGDILKGYERSKVPGKGVMASLLCWSVSYQLGVFFGETHRRAGGICQRLLEEYAVHHLRAIRNQGLPLDGGADEGTDGGRSLGGGELLD